VQQVTGPWAIHKLHYFLAPRAPTIEPGIQDAAYRKSRGTPTRRLISLAVPVLCGEAHRGWHARQPIRRWAVFRVRIRSERCQRLSRISHGRACLNNVSRNLQENVRCIASNDSCSIIIVAGRASNRESAGPASRGGEKIVRKVAYGRDASAGSRGDTVT
jgi:hypothetical protein